MAFDYSRIFLDPDMVGPENEREAKLRAGFWKTVKAASRRIPFMEDVVAAYYCTLDPATPSRVRLTLVGALAYFVLPLDIIPDFLPFAGFTDDIGVLTAALGMVAGAIKPEHREAAKRAMRDPPDP